MASVFTRIIDGDLPGRFVWRDEVCAAFLSINPLSTGHALIVPREETDHWVDLPETTTAHLMVVAQRIGQAQMAAFTPARIGQMIVGFEVPHVHIHVMGVEQMADFDFAGADPDPDPAEMDDARQRLSAALRDAGHDPGVD